MSADKSVYLDVSASRGNADPSKNVGDRRDNRRMPNDEPTIEDDNTGSDEQEAVAQGRPPPSYQRLGDRPVLAMASGDGDGDGQRVGDGSGLVCGLKCDDADDLLGRVRAHDAGSRLELSRRAWLNEDRPARLVSGRSRPVPATRRSARSCTGRLTRLPNSLLHWTLSTSSSSATSQGPRPRSLTARHGPDQPRGQHSAFPPASDTPSPSVKLRRNVQTLARRRSCP